ncbi:MAG TPA: carboxypeptidase regulatory-like domain-containing protein, partial [Acidobacteriaceae bacterium]
FNYAWSKTMDSGTSNGHNLDVDVWQNANNVAANYGLSQLDATNTFNGWGTYELPLGEGRAFHLHGLLDEAFGGWRATGVFQVHSGIPFTPTISGQDNSNSEANQCYCGFAWLPNVVHSPKVAHQTIQQWFDPTAFVTPAFATLGDERRNSLRGPNWRELDLSAGKTFAIREQMHFEVRADAFNALNHPNFYQPSSGVGTGATGGGVISGANSARQLQLGGRYTF